jgi:adenine/guanine phosphoribosyltransferase-like PRPP-binding protein
MLEKLLREMEKVEVFRKVAIEFKGETFPGLEGWSIIDGIPYHVVEGIPHYYYIVEEVSERLFRHSPRTLDECALAVMAVTDMEKVDVIGAMEAMAIPICTSLSLKARKPMVVIGKRKSPGSNVLLVEPISSTGGTLRRVTEKLEENGINVLDMITVVGKPDYKYEEEVELSGKGVKTLLKVYLKSYEETGDGHGFCETELVKTEWFRKVEPVVDMMYPRYEKVAERLLEDFR